MADVPWWQSALLMAIGGTGTAALAWLNPAMMSRFEQLRKQEERRQTFADRRRDFELTTIQGLIDALHRLARNTTRAHLFDVETAKQTGTLGKTNIPEDIEAEYLVVGRDVRTLQGLLLDEGLRLETARIQGLWTQVLIPTPSSIRDAQARYDNAEVATIALQERLATRLRELWEESS